MTKEKVEGGLPPISIKRLSGEERFHCLGRDLDLPLLDFWRWSASNLIDNTLRGTLAEFIVASALGLAGGVRVEWDAFDLLTPEGLKVEVKSSSYIQSWYQKEYSKIEFGIPPTRAYSAITNAYAPESRRQADVYVFCHLKHKVQETLNPLDLGQWDFYVLPTRVLDEKMGKRQAITLKQLEELGAAGCGYGKLMETVERAGQRQEA